MLRRLAPLWIVLGVVAFGAYAVGLGANLSPTSIALVLGGAVLAAAVVSWLTPALGPSREGAVLPVAGYGVLVGISFLLVTDPRAQPWLRSFADAWLSIASLAVMTALAGGAALAHFQVGYDALLRPRGRALLVAAVIASGVVARLVVDVERSTPLVAFLEIGGAAVLAAMATAPLQSLQRPRRAAFLALGLGAYTSGTRFLELADHYFSNSFSLRSPLVILVGTVHNAEAAAYGAEVALIPLAPVLTLAAWLAWRVGLRRTVTYASPLLAIALATSTAHRFLERASVASVSRYVGRVTDASVDVPQRSRPATWLELECPVQRALVVHHDRSVAVSERALLAEQIRFITEHEWVRMPEVSVLADRDTTLGEILAFLDPDQTRTWLVDVVFEAPPPFDPITPLATAFPRIRAQVAIAHRWTEDQVREAHRERAYRWPHDGRSPAEREAAPMDEIVLDDGTTVEQLVERSGTSSTDAFFRTRF